MPLRIEFKDDDPRGVGSFSWQLPDAVAKYITDLDKRAQEFGLPVDAVVEKQKAITNELETRIRVLLHFLIAALYMGKKVEPVLTFLGEEMLKIGKEMHEKFIP